MELAREKLPFRKLGEASLFLCVEFWAATVDEAVVGVLAAVIDVDAAVVLAAELEDEEVPAVVEVVVGAGVVAGAPGSGGGMLVDL